MAFHSTRSSTHGPLSPSSENAQDLNPLTPGHFLIGSPLLTPAEPDVSNGNITLANRWQKWRIQHHYFCRRWKEELHKHYKWKNPQQQITFFIFFQVFIY